jgi:hydroxyacylglutathione hydrolase
MYKNYLSKLLMPGVWEITDKVEGEDLSVDVYLIEGSERALLVDAGYSNTDLVGYLKKLTDKPIDLLVTHGHGDHAACIDQFERVYMSHKDIDILNTIFGFKIDETMVIHIQGGEIFDLGSCKLQVITLPGHTEGSMLLLDRERQLLFTSDALGSGGIWMQLPHCTPVEAYAKELRRLEKLVEDLNELKIFVGHDCQRGLDFGRQYITDIRILAEKIVSGEVEGIPSGDVDGFFGGLKASYGQMEEFLYKPNNICIKDNN